MSTHKMNRYITTTIVAGAVGVLTLLTSCKNKATQAEPAAQETTAIAVVTLPVERMTIEQIITLTGELSPTEMVSLAPKISGRLERLALDDGTCVEENTVVQAGQIVAVLEHQDLKAQLERADAGYKTAEAGIKQALADLEEKQRDKNRMDNLFREGSATEKQKDFANTVLMVAQATVESVKAQLSEAEAAVKQARIMLDEAFIKTPISGVVVRKFIDVGNIVSPATPVVSIIPMDTFKYLLDVPTQYLSTIDMNSTQIRLLVDAWPDKVFSTKIKNIYSQVNSQTRTFTVELSVRNEKTPAGFYMLRPGMYGTSQIVLDRRENVIAVPASSLVRLSGKYLAYVVENNVARRKDVEVGLWSGSMMEIKSGLEVGWQLVVNGQHKLTDNAPVEIVNPSSRKERTEQQ